MEKYKRYYFKKTDNRLFAYNADLKDILLLLFKANASYFIVDSGCVDALNGKIYTDISKTDTLYINNIAKIASYSSDMCLFFGDEAAVKTVTENFSELFSFMINGCLTKTLADKLSAVRQFGESVVVCGKNELLESIIMAFDDNADYIIKNYEQGVLMVQDRVNCSRYYSLINLDGVDEINELEEVEAIAKGGSSTYLELTNDCVYAKYSGNCVNIKGVNIADLFDMLEDNPISCFSNEDLVIDCYPDEYCVGTTYIIGMNCELSISNEERREMLFLGVGNTPDLSKLSDDKVLLRASSEDDFMLYGKQSRVLAQRLLKKLAGEKIEEQFVLENEVYYEF